MDNIFIHIWSVPIQARPELAPEQLHPHNSKDEPEDYTHDKHVGDRGNSLDQRVNYDLQQFTRTQGQIFLRSQ